MKLKYTGYTFIIFILINAQVFCGGTEFNSITGAKTISLNNLFIAGSDGLTSVYKNPAGLSFISSPMIDLSIVDQMGQQKFINNNSVRRSFRYDDFTIGGGLALKLGNNFTAAVAYLPVTDYRTEWPFLSLRSNDSLSSILGFNVFNRIRINSITPAVSILFDNISIGASVNIYVVDFNMAFPVNNVSWMQGAGVAAYQMEYKLDALSFGFTLGAQADLNDQLKLGAVIRSGFNSSLEGDASTRMFAELDSTVQTSNVKTDFEMPWQFGLGIVYSLQPDLKINIDAQYNLWGSTKDKLDFEFDNSTWQNGLSSSDEVYGFTPASFNFKNNNSLQAGIGIEYYPLDYLAIRAGYRYSESSNSEENYNLLFPDVSLHNLSAGFALSEENLMLEAAVLYSIGIEKSINTTLPVLTGNYSSDNIVPVLTLKYKF